MWNRNFLFRSDGSVPLPQTENDLFHETVPAVDSTGLNMEKFISVWLQGEGEDQTPTAYTSIYVRTATLDPQKHTGFLQPLQGRTHQIKKILTLDQKIYLKDWLIKTSPAAWEEAGDQFQEIFEKE